MTPPDARDPVAEVRELLRLYRDECGDVDRDVVSGDAILEIVGELAKRTRVEWAKGPPPGQGQWWIHWTLRNPTETVVEAVAVEPALISNTGRLLLKRVGGCAFDFAANASAIHHHAPIVCPPAPKDPTQ